MTRPPTKRKAARLYEPGEGRMVPRKPAAARGKGKRMAAARQEGGERGE